MSDDKSDSGDDAGQQEAPPGSTPVDEPTSSSGSPDSSGDSDAGGASEEIEASEPGDVGDDMLPPDLQPTEDNPLARHPDQTGNEEDTIGADREEAPQTAPLKAEDADYGSGGSETGGGDAPEDGRVSAEEDDGSESLDNGGGGAG